jgi:hypothetical protein
LDLRGGYLYEHRPDIIPQGYLTNEELAIWAAYYELKQRDGRHTANR